MDWLQISIETATPEPAEDCLLESGAVAVTLADAADQPLLEPLPGTTPLWDRVMVTGLFPSDQDPDAIKRALQSGLHLATPPDCRITLLEDRDWVRAWMERYEPLRFGERLWICPHHHEVQVADAIVVKLDPGLAFGTGTHPTTALCLQWLDQADLKGKAVVDYGCGSGILAIAAAMLGAASVIAVDIDPQALAATADNAQRNGVSERIQVGLPDDIPELGKQRQADIVIANILAGPLQELAPQLQGLLNDPGQLVLAGLLDTQMQDVQQSYAEHIQWQTPAKLEGWTRLNGQLDTKGAAT